MAVDGSGFALFLFVCYSSLVLWGRRCLSTVEERHMASAEGTGWSHYCSFFLLRRMKIICTMKQENGAVQQTSKQIMTALFLFISIHMCSLTSLTVLGTCTSMHKILTSTRISPHSHPMPVKTSPMTLSLSFKEGLCCRYEKRACLF